MPISEKDLLALLDHYCDPSSTLGVLSECQTVVELATPAATRAKGAEIPPFMQGSTLRTMHQMNTLEAPTASRSEATTDYAALFAKTTSLVEAGDIVAQGLTRKLAKTLSMPPKDIDIGRPLHAYRVDSLLAVELRNWFAKEMSADVAIFNIMGGSSIAAVSITVAENSQFRQASWAV